MGLIDTFWDHVDQSAGPDACWPWTRARVPFGHGSVYDRRVGQQVGAHRIAYEMAIGPIPRNTLVRHACDNPPCCNPSHLLLGTPLDNRRDCVERGRVGDTTPHNPARGEAQHCAKLTEQTAWELRCDRQAGMTWQQLADKYGLTTTGAQAVGKGKWWKHVPMPEGPPAPNHKTGGIYNASLTAEQIPHIRSDRRAGMTYAQLAEKYGVARSTVSLAVKGITWSHIPME